jgi:2'-5' RNA ligase
MRASEIETKKEQLYVCRNLLNVSDLRDWAKSQGFKSITEDNDFHVTIAYSKEKIEWDVSMEIHNKIKNTSTDRKIEQFGDAVVLTFNSGLLSERWAEIINDLGASWDYPSYKPHITLTWKWTKGKEALKKVVPYAGPLIFGPEIFSKLESDWKDDHKEQILEQELTDSQDVV